jgi:hypothetical protein
MPVGELTPPSGLIFLLGLDILCAPSRRTYTRPPPNHKVCEVGRSSRRKTEHARVSPLAFLARVRLPPRFDILEPGRGAPADTDVAVGNAGLNLVGEILPLGV